MGRRRTRDIVRGYVVESLATDKMVLAIDDTGFLKQGKAFCSVARQYTGSAGKITNCQIGVCGEDFCVRAGIMGEGTQYILTQGVGDSN